MYRTIRCTTSPKIASAAENNVINKTKSGKENTNPRTIFCRCCFAATSVEKETIAEKKCVTGTISDATGVKKSFNVCTNVCFGCNIPIKPIIKKSRFSTDSGALSRNVNIPLATKTISTEYKNRGVVSTDRSR